MIEKQQLMNTVVALSTQHVGVKAKERILRNNEFNLTIRPNTLPRLGQQDEYNG